jgi:thiol-disulfide isomerase/thioredoxin
VLCRPFSAFDDTEEADVTEHETPEAELIELDDIDLSFVPRKSDELSEIELDGEVLIVHSGAGTVHVLDQIGATVWSCFDGEVDLGTLVADLADAFNADPAVVEEDVLTMTRRVGASRLLEGVAPPRMSAPMPTGLEVGESLPDFTLDTMTGDRVSLASLGKVLLVNWSPNCGYCLKIAPELGAAQQKLADAGVTLAFLTAGDVEANRTVFDDAKLDALAFMRESQPDDFEDPFPAMGTPVAYLLDADGTVAAPLGYGADQVPALVRTAAGIAEPEPEAPAAAADHDHDHDHDHQEENTGPKYLPAGGGVCGPGASGKKPRVWAATSAYAIGEFHIGVRADSLATDELLARAFAPYRLDAGTEAPDNYSVVLADQSKSGSRSLNLLLAGSSTIVRSRSAKRVLNGLANYLSTLVEPEDNGALLKVGCVGAVIGGEGLLLPSVVKQWLEPLQPRLTRQGIQLVDTPYAVIDPDSVELVVPAPSIVADPGVLSELAEPSLGRSELPAVEPGRYPLRAWALAHNADRPPSRGQNVAAAVSAVFDVEDLGAFVPTFSELLDRLMPLPMTYSSADELASALKDNLAAVG